jgi:tetratricopeptide (TPR) repeat protein
MALLGAPAPGQDPVADAYRLLAEGRPSEAEALLTKAPADDPPLAARALLLRAQIHVAAGAPAEALALLERGARSLGPLRPWPALLGAEASIRSGHPDGAREMLRRTLEDFGDSTPVVVRSTHLLTLAERFGRVPDEPAGLAPAADLGTALAIRLGLCALPATGAANPAIERSRRLETFGRDRLPRAPLLTLATTNRQAGDAPCSIVLAFLGPEHAEMGGFVERELVPLLHRHGPTGRLRGAVVLAGETPAACERAVAALRAMDRRGELALLSTVSSDAFLCYGVRKPPFLLAVDCSDDHRIVDWEPPWGLPAMFFHRLRARLAEE